MAILSYPTIIICRRPFSRVAVPCQVVPRVTIPRSEWVLITLRSDVAGKIEGLLYEKIPENASENFF